MHELNALLNLEEKGNQTVILEEEEKEGTEELPKREEDLGVIEYKKEGTSIVAEEGVSYNTSSRVSENKTEYQVQPKEVKKSPSKISVKERLAKMKEKASIPKKIKNKEVKKKQEPCL